MPNPATLQEHRRRMTKAQLIDEIGKLEQREAATLGEITELNQHEHEPAKKEAQLQILLDNNVRGAIIYVIDPFNISIVSTRGIAKLYGLSPAKDAIYSLLIEGLATQEIAETRSVHMETVRSQI